MGERHIGRYTVAEAADMLGITTGAVRNRLSRGTLRSVKEHGTVYVLLPDDMSQGIPRDADETPHDMSGERDVLVSEMRGRIDDLRSQLEAERRAHAEARRIIAGLIERLPPQLEPARAGEAEPPDEPGNDLTATEDPDRGMPRSNAPGPRETLHRPWWRRVFGRE